MHAYSHKVSKVIPVVKSSPGKTGTLKLQNLICEETIINWNEFPKTANKCTYHFKVHSITRGAPPYACTMVDRLHARLSTYLAADIVA